MTTSRTASGAATVIGGNDLTVDLGIPVQQAQAAQWIATIRCPAGFLVDADGDHDERGACQIRIVPICRPGGG